MSKLHNIVWKPVKENYAVDNESHVFQTYYNNLIHFVTV